MRINIYFEIVWASLNMAETLPVGEKSPKTDDRVFISRLYDVDKQQKVPVHVTSFASSDVKFCTIFRHRQRLRGRHGRRNSVVSVRIGNYVGSV